MEYSVECINSALVYRRNIEQSEEKSDIVGILVEKLNIPRGKLIAIIGPSGSGKSTLLSILGSLKAHNVCADDSLFRLLMPEGRTIDLLAGQIPLAGDVAYVFQESHLMKPLSVLANFEAGGLIAGRNVGLTQFKEFAKHANLTVGMDDKTINNLAAGPVGMLSGGQAQRIAVGRALETRPDILFCDEPTSSLDSNTGAAVMGLIKNWIEESGKTAIWVTHNIEQAAEFADCFLVTSSGRLLTNDGLPFDLDKPDRDGRVSQMEARLGDAALLEPLSAKALAEHGINNNLHQTGIVAQAAKNIDRIAVLPFLASCVISDMYRGGRSDYAVALATNHGAKLQSGETILSTVFSWIQALFTVLFRTLNNFKKWSMASALLIGLLAAYGGVLSLDVYDRYLDFRLRQPSLAHFVVVGDGTKFDENVMSMRAVGKLRRVLSNKFPETDGVIEPQVFGRWRDPFASIGPAIGETCAENPGNQMYTALLTVNAREPLFKGIFDSTRNLAGDAGQQRTAVVTEDLLNQIKTTDSEKPPEGVCLYLPNPTYFKISSVQPSLPGAGKFTYSMAIKEKDYLRIYQANVPASGYDSRGRVQLPLFTNAAIYFDPSYAEQLICEFTSDRNSGAGKKCNVSSERKGYVTNGDSLRQLSGFLSVAGATQKIIVLTIFVFLVSIALTVILALQAFVQENEKFLCILKIFRYRRRHLIFIVALQSFVLLSICAAISGIILGLFHWLVLPRIAMQFDIPAVWVAFSPLIFAYSWAGLLGLAWVISIAVILVWWHLNPYVGNKLQAI